MFEQLEKKKIGKGVYFYYSRWAWVDGKCRRVWQRYLGKLEDIVKAVEGKGRSPVCADIFSWGLPLALWRQARRAGIVEIVDRRCPKRQQGMSVGEYINIAALNRAIDSHSKRSMWEWFSKTVLLRLIPAASREALTSQRFWDHMDKLDRTKALASWEEILAGAVAREQIDLSSICYDGTNFYTFIDTFNARCEIAKRGRNKQGRSSLRQVNYALFCCADGSLPLYYEVYEGNRNDARQFPLVLENFGRFFTRLRGGAGQPPKTTLIFDKGNNSAANFALIDRLTLDFVGSVKLDEHKELAEISNADPRFEPCEEPELEGARTFRVKKEVYGKERLLVVTFNQNLYDAQWLTLNQDVTQALGKLLALKQRLQDRADGLIAGGRAPTLASVKKQCEAALTRPFLKEIVKVKATLRKEDIPELSYRIDQAAQQRIADTWLGKNILISSQESWNDTKIVKAYRSQYLIEDIFKQMKDRKTGPWWPMGHWTDSKIEVHGLYCTIAVLLRGLLMRKVAQADLKLSLKRLMTELADIREVVNIYPKTRRQKTEPTQPVLSRCSELQEKLIAILALNENENDF